MPTITPSQEEEEGAGVIDSLQPSLRPHNEDLERKKISIDDAKRTSVATEEIEHQRAPKNNQKEGETTDESGVVKPEHETHGMNARQANEMTKRKKVGELSNILLDMRRNLHADHNLVGPFRGDDDRNNNGDNEFDAKRKISDYTLVRAEKVKTVLGMKYIYLQRMYEWSEQNEDDGERNGIEGVYNPLQILRNRKIRDKQQVKIEPLAFKTLPLACNVFSNHNKKGRKNWKMEWSLDVDEFLFDLRWRNNNLHELRKHNGELWFPPKKKGYKSTPKEPEKRLHDKLFQAEKIDEDVATKESTSSTKAVSSDDEDNHIFRITRRNKKTYNKFKDALRSRKYSNSISISSSGSTENDEDSSMKTANRVNPPNQLKDQLFKRVARSPERQLYANESPDISVTIDKVPQIVLDPVNKQEDMSLEKLTIERIEKKDLPFSPDESQDSPEDLIPLDDADSRNCQIYRSLYYINAVAGLRESYLQYNYPLLMVHMLSKVDTIISKQINGILSKAMNINDKYLASNDNMFNEVVNEVKSITQVINDDYSIRIDNLLTNADRPIGEIHTSLSLEVRKINERLDKLNLQLFKSSLTGPSGETNFTANLSTQRDYRILYLVLENFIVVILRLVWITVNIYKLFMMILKFILKVIMSILL